MNEPLSTPAPYAWVKGDYEIIIDLERQLAAANNARLIEEREKFAALAEMDEVRAQLAERTRERDEARDDRDYDRTTLTARAESVERQMEKMREALRKLLDHINVYFDDPNCDICANARAALAQQEGVE